MSEKLTARHLERRALIYVRQSSHQQLVHNPESRRLQYEMEKRVRDLGWQETEVIDEDQGRSAATATGRTGFQRMVAEVCLGRVGAVAAIEVSRFARNNRDWHQMIEMCSLVDTLLIDHEGIYDPRRPNDRLLLGLKGSMSEYELDLLRQRSLEARWAKAKRGELVIQAPVGFREDRGSTFGKGSRSSRSTSHRSDLRQVLRVGKRSSGSDVAHRAPCRRAGEAAECEGMGDPVAAACLSQRDQCPERTNVRRCLRLRTDGISRAGQKWRTAQDSGSKTPRRVDSVDSMVAYSGKNASVPRYQCHRGRLDNMEAKCISFGGTSADAAVSKEILNVVRPGAVEAAVLAVTQDKELRDQRVQTLTLELEAARYAAERARRQLQTYGLKTTRMPRGFVTPSTWKAIDVYAQVSVGDRDAGCATAAPAGSRELEDRSRVDRADFRSPPLEVRAGSAQVPLRREADCKSLIRRGLPRSLGWFPRARGNRPAFVFNNSAPWRVLLAGQGRDRSRPRDQIVARPLRGRCRK